MIYDLLKSNKTDFNIEHRIINPKNNIIKWITEIGDIIRNKNNKALRVVGIVQDITSRKKVEHLLKKEQLETEKDLLKEKNEHKKTEKELINREKVFETVYNIATQNYSSEQDLVDITAKSIANFLDIDFVVIRIKKRKAKEISSINIKRSLNDMNQIFCNACLDINTIDSLPFQINDKIYEKRKDCKIISEQKINAYMYVPILDNSENIRGSICLLDKRKKIFNKKESHIIEIFSHYLGHIIMQNELSEELRKNKELETLGKLTSGVAHEVRNPLNAISIMTEALFREIGNNKDYKEYKKHIEMQVDRLSKLMENLLALGRPVKEINMAKINLSEICKQTVNSWNISNYNKVKYTNENNNIQAYIIGDTLKIEQVLTNLIENASQHSDKEPIIFKLSGPFKSLYKIQIIDKGKGIKPENIKKIFDPFFTTRKKGTGLGLNIVKHIIESHNGKIQIFNNISCLGCTVEINLPAAY